jgi:hypothetical protein
MEEIGTTISVQSHNQCQQPIVPLNVAFTGPGRFRTFAKGLRGYIQWYRWRSGITLCSPHVASGLTILAAAGFRAVT